MKKGHSESVWACHQHEGEVRKIGDHMLIPAQTGVRYTDIAETGIPLCWECDRYMEFVREEWIED